MLRSNRGFTLVEMMIVVLLMGLMLGFAVPALRRLSNSQGLKGARENMVSQLQLARARAMSTGTDQTMHFFPGTYGYDYHLHTGNPVGWNFPRGVTYGWATTQNIIVTLKADGSISFPSGVSQIPLMDTQGTRDTVAMLTSGLVLAQ